MAFIRTKKIKNKEYAYIVENKWRKRGNKVKQKTKKYLGRVYRHDKVNEEDFYQFHNIEDVDDYLEDKDKEEVINDLLKWELKKHGFEEKENKWVKKNCFLDIDKKKIYNKKGNKIALGINEGFLTDYTVRRIINFSADTREEGYDFAKMFVEAGISIPKQIFVELFKKSME